MNIADIRKEYRQRVLLEADAAADPMQQFRRWFDEALAANVEEVNAMTLATASAEGVPAARIVLLKGFDASGFVFFTNYSSAKGAQLEENPRACLVFFWAPLERQVRITGLVSKTSAEESTAYYNSRPLSSRIGAWASPQSSVIAGREWLESNEKKLELSFEGKDIERPAHWGGYRVQPVSIEFWQGRESRLHDRLLYTTGENGTWKVERLAP